MPLDLDSHPIRLVRTNLQRNIESSLPIMTRLGSVTSRGRDKPARIFKFGEKNLVTGIVELRVQGLLEPATGQFFTYID